MFFDLTSSQGIQISIFRLFTMFSLLNTVPHVAHYLKSLAEFLISLKMRLCFIYVIFFQYCFSNFGNDFMKDRDKNSPSKFCQSCTDCFMLPSPDLPNTVVGNLSLEQKSTHLQHMTKFLSLMGVTFCSYLLLPYQNIFAIFGRNIFWVRWADTIIFIQSYKNPCPS